MNIQEAIYILNVPIADPDNWFREAADLLGLDGYFLLPFAENMKKAQELSRKRATKETLAQITRANFELDLIDDISTPEERLSIFRRFLSNVKEN